MEDLSRSAKVKAACGQCSGARDPAPEEWDGSVKGAGVTMRVIVKATRRGSGALAFCLDKLFTGLGLFGHGVHQRQTILIKRRPYKKIIDCEPGETFSRPLTPSVFSVS